MSMEHYVFRRLSVPSLRSVRFALTKSTPSIVMTTYIYTSPMIQAACCARIIRQVKCKTLNSKKMNKNPKVGDYIRIKHLLNEDNRYDNRVGEIKYIDDAGQLHGTWGGLAVLEDDDYEILPMNKEKIRTKVHELMSHMTESMDEKLESLLESNVIDYSEWEDNWILPKYIMHAMCKIHAEQFEPPTPGRNFNKNIDKISLGLQSLKM